MSGTRIHYISFNIQKISMLQQLIIANLELFCGRDECSQTVTLPDVALAEGTSLGRRITIREQESASLPIIL
jgi:hypothetical protein